MWKRFLSDCLTRLYVPRSAHLLSRYRPRAPILAVTRNAQTARQAHLYRGIFPVLYTNPPNDVWAEDVDMRVNFAMEMGRRLWARSRAACYRDRFPQKKKKKNVSGFISRQGQRLLQGGGCCHHLDRLAPRLRLHQHHACGSGGLNSQKRAAYSLHLHYILSFIVLHSTVPKAYSSDPNLQSAH